MIKGLNISHRLIYIASLFLIVFIFYLSTVLTYIVRWSTDADSYSHGYMVLLICLYLVYRSWPDIEISKSSQSIMAILLLLGANLFWLAGHAAQVNFIQQFILPIILWLSFMSLLGWHASKHFILPVLLIYMTIPVWEWLIPNLQALAVQVSNFVLKFANISAYIEGNVITIPSGNIEVSIGCSGLNYFLVAITLSLLIGHLNNFSLRKNILLLIFAIFLSLVSNWVRIVSLIFIAHITKMQSPLLSDHATFGWFTFLIALIPLIIVSNYIHSDRDDNGPDVIIQKRNEIKLQYFFLICLISISGPVSAHFADKTIDSKKINLSIDSPIVSTQPIYNKTQWQPDFHNESFRLTSDHNINDTDFKLSIYFYARQTNNSELINFNNRIFSHGYRLVSQETVDINANGGSNVKLLHLINKISDEYIIVIHWFNVAGRNTTNKYFAKLLQIIGYIEGNLDASLISISSTCNNTKCDEIKGYLRNITGTYFSKINNEIATARNN